MVMTCRRLALNRLSPLQPPPPVTLYERDRPAEFVHPDTKKLTPIGAVGRRISGERRRLLEAAGWEHFHASLFYDGTRTPYGEMLADEKIIFAAFRRRALARFGRRCGNGETYD